MEIFSRKIPNTTTPNITNCCRNSGQSYLNWVSKLKNATKVKLKKSKESRSINSENSIEKDSWNVLINISPNTDIRLLKQINIYMSCLEKYLVA